jgi:hypothetical protein
MNETRYSVVGLIAVAHYAVSPCMFPPNQMIKANHTPLSKSNSHNVPSQNVLIQRAMGVVSVAGS